MKKQEYNIRHRYPKDPYVQMPHRLLDLARAGFVTQTALYVYSHMEQRASGHERGCFESKPQMAKILKVGHNQLREAIRLLNRLQIIEETQRINESPIIFINPSYMWSEETKTVPTLAELDRGVYPNQVGGSTQFGEGGLPESGRATTPLPNNKDLTKTIEQEQKEHTQKRARDEQDVVLPDEVKTHESKLAPISLIKTTKVGNGITTSPNKPKKASKASTEVSVALHPDLVLEWRGYLEAQAPQLLKSFNPLQAGKDLEEVRKYLGCEIGFLFKVLEWVKKHDFWASRAVSIRGLMKKSSGSDLRMIDSIIGQMKTDKSYKRQTILENIDISDNDLYF